VLSLVTYLIIPVCTGSRAAVLDERASSCRLRVNEEGSGYTARSAPSELGERGN
jgi:hypothetical protein